MTDKEQTSRREFVARTGLFGMLAAVGLVRSAEAAENDSVTLDEEARKAFEALPKTGTIVMLNMLKFAPDGGQASFMKYAAAVGPLLEKHGAKSIYAGLARAKLIGTQEWDMIALVEWKSRQDFADMIYSPEYQAISHLREDGLERAVLYATTPLTR